MLIAEAPKTHTLMQRTGMASLFISSPKSSTFSHLSFPSSHTTPSSPCQTFSESMMEENIKNAKLIITKWDPNSSSLTKVTSLFHHNRKEAKEFLKSVKDLRQVMHFLVSENKASDKLALAQNLVQIAMKRLEKEFYQILSKNRDQLDPDSVSGHSSSEGTSNFDDEYEDGSDDELKRAGDSITEVERVSVLAMSDLKLIADCMISCGYGKECVKIYKLIRISIVEEGLYQLGIERFKSSHFQKMNWEALDHVVKNWLNAVKIAVKTLFQGEKILCDHVLSASKTIREACFSEIMNEGAINLFRFPELMAKHKKLPERIFRLMDLYEAISDLWPEIDSIFSFESTSAIKSQALSSLHKLGESIQTILSDFESTILKGLSKTPVPGGGIHPLTQSAMSYISSLAEYSRILSDIVVNYPPQKHSPFPESYFESPTSNDSSTSAVSVHLAWLMLVLLCKLDRKAALYKDVALSYLFLANNLRFIIEKICATPLRNLLGDEWLFRHAKKVRQFAMNYEAMAWNKVFSSLPEKTSPAIPPEAAKECFMRFNAAFEEAYKKQTSWIVPDGRLRDELKLSIAKKLVPAYREFYDTYLAMLSGETNLEVLVKFHPDDLKNCLSDLFHGTPISGNPLSSPSVHVRGCIPR